MTLAELKDCIDEVYAYTSNQDRDVMIYGNAIRFADWVPEEISPYAPLDFSERQAHWVARDFIADLTLEDKEDY